MDRGLRSWVKFARLPLGFRLFHSPHETHTHTRHAPRQSLSLSSCEQSLVSRPLSVASLISCLLCVSCPLSVLFCLCLLFVFPPTVRLSVCLCLQVARRGEWHPSLHQFMAIRAVSPALALSAVQLSPCLPRPLFTERGRHEFPSLHCKIHLDTIRTFLRTVCVCLYVCLYLCPSVLVSVSI